MFGGGVVWLYRHLVGVDELYVVGNRDPAHPMDYREYVLEQIDAATGRTMDQKPWPQPQEDTSMSHSYRHFIVGGQVEGYFEGDGTVMDRQGRVLGKTGGLTALNSRFTGKPGEQMLSYHADGKVRIWFDRNAADTPAATARCGNHRAKAARSGCRPTGSRRCSC
jgi:hypothetical protein